MSRRHHSRKMFWALGGKEPLRGGGEAPQIAVLARLGLPVLPGVVLAAPSPSSSPDLLTKYVDRALASPRLKSAIPPGLLRVHGQRVLPSSGGGGLPEVGSSVVVENVGVTARLVQAAAASTHVRLTHNMHYNYLVEYARLVLPDLADDVLSTATPHNNNSEDEDAVYKERASRLLASMGDEAHTQLKRILVAMFQQGATCVVIQHQPLHASQQIKGTCFTRNPDSGVPELCGEYVDEAGVLRPLQQLAPAFLAQLQECAHKLEQHYLHVQHFDFAVREGHNAQGPVLYITRTRRARLAVRASVKTAVDMHKSGLLVSKADALLRVDAKQLDQLLHKQLAHQHGGGDSVPLGRGMPASPGAAVGQCALTSQQAMEMHRNKQPVVLVRLDTSPEDVQATKVVQGLLVQRGGLTSHAAVLARGLGKCCITGCDAVQPGAADGKSSISIGNRQVRAGDWLTLDGATGEVFWGRLPVRDAVLDDDFTELMQWADDTRTLQVRTNADTVKDVKQAMKFGAEGVGLVRTEHMFFAPERITVMRTMILATLPEQRTAALARLLDFQQRDFEALFRELAGLPVVIRLLDPPFHEFVSRLDQAELDAVAAALGGSTADSVAKQIDALRESNPMLGFRGCRLGLVYPEITEMQLRAIYQAAVAVGVPVWPEVEVPLVGHVDEFRPIKQQARRMYEACGAEAAGVPFCVGSMIEVPRAVLESDVLASECDFLSFGTNDLTQMTLGFSRDDAGRFVGEYVRRGIYSRDPFVAIDEQGVGKMMKLCVALARGVNKGLDIGICGEHGGEPSSVEFCHRIGLSNVSCSPFRVPVARLAAAQARIKYGPAPQQLDLVKDVFARL